MPIRLSGMVSGMDTETLVSALVSGYKLKKDNLVKAQTKLSWKQEKWKTMNTSIYSFYSGKLSAGRLSNAYSLKKSTVSNSTVATVTASSSAVAGTQKLKVKQLATSGYLTGGEISTTDKGKVTGSTKMSDITGQTSGSLTLSVERKISNIELTEDMTVNQFVSKLKSAGVQASFDESNQRFFISSKTSGTKGDFSLSADDANGFAALQSLGLYVTKVKSADGKSDIDSPELAEYRKWSGYITGDNAYDTSASLEDNANTELGKIILNAYNNQKTSFDTVAKNKLDEYNAIASKISAFETKFDPAKLNGTEIKYGDDALTQANGMLAANKKRLFDTFGYKDGEEFDESSLADEQKKEFEELKNSTESLQKEIDAYTAAKDIELPEAANYVNITTDADGNTTVTALKSTDTRDGISDKIDAVNKLVDDSNNELKTKLTNYYVNKAEESSKIVASSDSVSNGAVRIAGYDSEIELNGATFKSNTNNYSINGLTILATAVTEDDSDVTITTDTDVDAIYKSIKDMFAEYNKLIKSMDEAYNADSSKGYEPLTDEEKDAMSDTEVEKWETKIKDSLLRKDDTLNSVANTLKNDMASSFIINGKSYALSSFGISTLGYFASGENEKGVYHIDGDKDDTTTSGNEDKLRAAIASDPETVVSFFSQLCTKLYTDLGNKMASSSVSSAYTIYNDKQMNTQYSEYNTKISDAESKVSTWEDYYYSKFSAMESALAKLNSQSSSMSGLFGS